MPRYKQCIDRSLFDQFIGAETISNADQMLLIRYARFMSVSDFVSIEEKVSVKNLLPLIHYIFRYYQLSDEQMSYIKCIKKKECVAQILKRNLYFIEYIHDDFKQDNDIILQLLKYDNAMVRLFSNSIQQQIQSIVESFNLKKIYHIAFQMLLELKKIKTLKRNFDTFISFDYIKQMGLSISSCSKEDFEKYKIIIIYALNEQDKLSDMNYLKQIYKNMGTTQDEKEWYNFIWKTYPRKYQYYTFLSETEFANSSLYQLKIAKKIVPHLSSNNYKKWLENYKYFWNTIKSENISSDDIIRYCATPTLDQRFMFNVHLNQHAKYIRDSKKYFGYILDLNVFSNI